MEGGWEGGQLIVFPTAQLPGVAPRPSFILVQHSQKSFFTGYILGSYWPGFNMANTTYIVCDRAWNLSQGYPWAWSHGLDRVDPAWVNWSNCHPLALNFFLYKRVWWCGSGAECCLLMRRRQSRDYEDQRGSLKLKVCIKQQHFNF